ncbi:hypothetical protein LINPERHAP1_LOCUS12951 [Linum perenne]
MPLRFTRNIPCFAGPDSIVVRLAVIALPARLKSFDVEGSAPMFPSSLLLNYSVMVQIPLMALSVPVFEFDVAVVSESQQRCTTSLLARFFFPKPKPRQWLHATLGRKWKLQPSEFRLTEVGHGLFQIFFVRKADLDKVMRGRPHAVDGYLISLIPWVTPSVEVFAQLGFAEFWVRLEEVPVEFRTIAFGAGLLQPIGQVLYTGLYDSPMENKELLRGFVRLDVEQPLLGRRKARYSTGEEFWVNFGYEGLPTVCFGCGRLGHALRQCAQPRPDDSEIEDRGSWMQAERGRRYHQIRD